MTKNERIAYLEAEVALLATRVMALERKPEPYNPWTPIGPSQSTNGYTCAICRMFVSWNSGYHACGSGWLNNSSGTGSVH